MKKKKIGVSCDFQVECDASSKVGKITCPYCDLELTLSSCGK